MPFSLVYGTDAMIPVEILKSSQCVRNFSMEESHERLRVNLDMIVEVWDNAWIYPKTLKRRIEKWHKTKVIPQQFKVIDLVLRRAHPYQV